MSRISITRPSSVFLVHAIFFLSLILLTSINGSAQCARPGLIPLKTLINPLGNAPPLSVADVNGDGLQDIAGFGELGTIKISLGDGSGNFGTPATYVIGGGSRPLEWGDLNGDGKPDLILSSGTILDVWMNNGSGGFTFTNSIPHTGFVATAVDFNGDAKGDLLSYVQDASGFLHSFSVRIGNGSGGFAAPTSFFPTHRTSAT